jgi:hypothetical protein
MKTIWKKKKSKIKNKKNTYHKHTENRKNIHKKNQTYKKLVIIKIKIRIRIKIEQKQNLEYWVLNLQEWKDKKKITKYLYGKETNTILQMEHL